MVNSWSGRIGLRRMKEKHLGESCGALVQGVGVGVGTGKMSLARDAWRLVIIRGGL